MDRELEEWNTRDVARLLAMVETERRYYQEVVTSIPVGLLIVSADLKIVSSNREVRTIFGNRSGEPMSGIVDQFLPSPILAQARAVIETGTPVSNLSMTLGGPPKRQLRVSIRQIRHWEDPYPEALLAIEETALANAAVEVRPGAWERGLPSEELLNSLDAIVWAIDLPSKRFMFVNEKAQELLGYPAEKWLNTPSYWADRIHPADRERVLLAYEQSIGSWSRHTCEYRAVSSYGKVVWLRESVRLLQTPAGQTQHLIGFAVDVTQRHILENEFVQAQRISAVNRLAARVASEIVNQVMIISGFSEEMTGSLEEEHPLQADLREVMAASGKLRTLASQLSSFHRHQALASEPFDVVEFLRQIEPDLRRRAGPGMTLGLTLFPAEIGIAVDPGQLQEIILTLVDRARLSVGLHAEGGGGLSVECSPLEIEDALEHRESKPRQGVYAVITVEDDGQTIDDDCRGAMFEALLPSLRALKEHGEDLGPALSRAYSLVRQWGGDILVSPAWPRGNVFQLFIPRIGNRAAIPARSPDPINGRRAPAPTAGDPLAGPRPHTILIVEEESGIRTLLRKMLRRQSYNVFEATDLAAAVEISRQNAAAVDLLIADAKSAGTLVQDGLKLLRESCPNLELLYLTGEEDVEKVQHLNPGAAMLEKPFTLGTLIAKVKEILTG